MCVCVCVCFLTQSFSSYFSPLSPRNPNEPSTCCSTSTLSLSHSLFIPSFIPRHENVSFEDQENPHDVTQHRRLRRLTHLSAARRRAGASFCLRTLYLSSLSLPPGCLLRLVRRLPVSVATPPALLGSLWIQSSLKTNSLKKMSSILGDLSIV